MRYGIKEDRKESKQEGKNTRYPSWLPPCIAKKEARSKDMRGIQKGAIMPTVHHVITYKFSELSEKGKSEALTTLCDINTRHDWWDTMYEDATNIDLKITDFDTYRGECNGKLTTSALESIGKVLKEHGDATETYQIALKHKELLEAIKDKESDEFYDAEEAYLTDILSCYLKMLKDDLDYQCSEEAIIETIEANEYDFTADGKLF